MSIKVYYRYIPLDFVDDLYNAYIDTTDKLEKENLLKKWQKQFVCSTLTSNILTDKYYNIDANRHPKECTISLTKRELLEVIAKLMNDIVKINYCNQNILH